MSLSAVHRPGPVATTRTREELTHRYYVDARLVRAARAAREARRRDCLPRERLLELACALREALGAQADRAVLEELARLDLTLDRVPRPLFATLIVALAGRLEGAERQAFVRRAAQLAHSV